ncbi:MAG: NAD(P)-dependent oxidoreductase [bacterium]|nr:NAD(P)-dependent oxidoreductase [bacterium]
MKVLGTGLTGLIGSRVVELLGSDYTFNDYSLDTKGDITKKDDVEHFIKASDAPWVFHFAAKTDVDACENERDLGEKSQAWLVNADATHSVAEACRQSGKNLLYISTDYVFDGTKDEYTEEDVPNPESWYARTKLEGERHTRSLGSSGLVLRVANPYRAFHPNRVDFVRRVLEMLKRHETVSAPSDQIFVPTFIDDIAYAIRSLVALGASGIYHGVGRSALSPYAAAQSVAHVFGCDEELVKPAKFERYFAGRAPRPFHAHLRNDKIARLGIHMSTFDEGLGIIQKQL